MKRNKIIGITGGIGSGKSLCLKYIEDNYPVTVIYADAVGKELMRPGEKVCRALSDYYGTEILNEDGTINTKRLSEIGLKDAASQKILNAIEHPIIKEEIERRAENADTSIIFIEAALLSEGGLTELCDEVWVVFTDREIRIERLMKDRGYSKTQCELFMDRQLSDEAFKALADRLILNNGDFEETKKMIRQYMTEAGKSLCE